MGMSSPVEVKKDQILSYVAHLNSLFAVKTVKRKLAALRSFFFYLEDCRVIEESPFYRIHLRIKEPFRMPQVLTLTEVKRMLLAASREEELPRMLHFRDVAVLEMLFCTGMRVQELCNLTTRDFNDRDNTLRIIGKGQKERRIAIYNPESLKILSRYMQLSQKYRRQSSWIFINRLGAPLSTQAVRNIVTKYALMAKVKKRVTPHMFRHTFATLLLEAGVDIRFIQEYLGHSSVTTTQIYLHVSQPTAKRILCQKHPRKTFSILQEDGL